MKQQTLSIIIPAYNEASTIFRLLEKVHHTRLVRDIRKEIIVVKITRKKKSCVLQELTRTALSFITNSRTIKEKELQFERESKKSRAIGQSFRTLTLNTTPKITTRYWNG